VGAKSALDLMLDDLIHCRKKLYSVTKEIKKLSETVKYSPLMGLLRSTPGIGLITGMTLITEIMDINRFQSFNKFNAFVGLYPNQFSSGEKVRMGKMTPRHNAYLRPLIIEAAWTSIRFDSALTLKFNEDCKRKTKKRAIVTIARKLLSRIYMVWTNGVLYEKGLK
jgi:transposase